MVQQSKRSFWCCAMWVCGMCKVKHVLKDEVGRYKLSVNFLCEHIYSILCSTYWFSGSIARKTKQALHYFWMDIKNKFSITKRKTRGIACSKERTFLCCYRWENIRVFNHFYLPILPRTLNCSPWSEKGM